LNSVAAPGSIRRMTSGIARRPSLIALSVALAATGCARMRNAELEVRDVGLAAHCEAFMRRAFPGADITVTKREATPDAQAATLTGAIARIEGVREKVPEGQFVAREVGVECRFDNGILVGFRWTAGPFR
jgi:hypothetical protein